MLDASAGQSELPAATLPPVAMKPIPEDPPESVDKELIKILEWPRPHGSFAERKFGTWIENKIKILAGKEPELLAQDCIYIRIPDKDGKFSTTLFSCHIDTMEDISMGSAVEVIDKGKSKMNYKAKSLGYDASFGRIALMKDSHGGCLGADNGAGVWLLLQLIRNKVPGGYIFHRGEERGGIGSRAVLEAHLALKKNPDTEINKQLLEIFDLSEYQVAVAFDRRHETNIITHQGRLRCCSDKFGLALAKALNQNGLEYTLDDTGSFTDTKVYRKVISECVNVSVGYDSEHTKAEALDYLHLLRLKKAILDMNWEMLPVDRDPKVEEYTPPVYSGNFDRNMTNYDNYGYGNHYGTRNLHGYPLYDDREEDEVTTGPANKPLANKAANTATYEELHSLTREELESWVEMSPKDATKYMIQLMLEIGRVKSDLQIMTNLAGVEFVDDTESQY